MTGAGFGANWLSGADSSDRSETSGSSSSSVVFRFLVFDLSSLTPGKETASIRAWRATFGKGESSSPAFRMAAMVPGERESVIWTDIVKGERKLLIELLICNQLLGESILYACSVTRVP